MTIKIKQEDIHGPAVEMLSMPDAMTRLCETRITNKDRIIAWAMHDAIVKHEQRSAVSRTEALRIIEIMQSQMPVTVLHVHEDSIEYISIALDDQCNKDAIEGWVWCSTYLPFDKNEPCETCIADECDIPALIAHLSCASNIE